jgi:hypothetical protein
MCGKALEVHVPVHAGKPSSPEASRRPPAPVSGPSFLGLGDDPSPRSSRDLKYLLDEDDRPRRTYGRFLLLLVILLAIAGLGWLEYSRGTKGWVAPWAKQVAQTPIQASQPDPSQTPPPLGGEPAASNSPSNTAKGDQAESKSSEPADKSADATEQPAKSEADHPAAKSEAKDTTASGQTPAKSAAPSAKKEDSDTENDKADSAKTDAESSDETPPAKPAKFAKASKPKVAPDTSPASPDDALVANAEKYLYGRGVPQNCDRALISMRAAAGRGNTRARSLLGSMYATGHCVPRDLPSAYRWFALASRADTENTWVQKNLEMIWREMTPQERQLATQRNQ